ncbi:MAG: hypothetical protein V9E99_19110 [Microthrixaceae bacterium]|jgi:uncharacterized protein YukE
MAMVGADADELDGIAWQLTSRANALADIGTQLGRQLHSAPWQGARADRFRSDWSRTHATAIRSASSFLRSAAMDLARNATEQRQASGADGGSCTTIATDRPGPTTPVTDSDSDVTDDLLRPIETFFDQLGLTEDIWKGVVKALRVTDPDALKDLGRFLAGHAEFLTFFKTIGKVLGVGEVVLDFVTDVSKQLGANHLPLDEAIFHSAIFAGAKFAETAGVEKLGQVIGASLGSALPVLGTAGGGFVGWAAGTGISYILSSLDDHFGFNERAADLATEAYRDAKDLAGDLGEFASDVYDGGKEFIGDAYTAAKDALDSAASNVETIADTMRSAANLPAKGIEEFAQWIM